MILLLLVAKFIIDPHQTHKLLKYQYPYPNLTQIKSTDLTQITFLLKIFAMDIFFQINLLLLQSLNKNPIQNNLPPLHSIKKKSPLFPHNTPTSPLHTTTICTITKVSISLEQHQETPNTMEKIREASSVLPNLC